ncbi:hypothetical protein CEP54_008981 [Fusarium duplospermum]|uniref:Cell wall mannoprotein PIR1-like C-terminal domain-containing protein n=1 Tax=Fusarium duplospermum TaxID=1325734 RepID=A0A428PSX7_9HYPO|nr:hypothetical protein CEP54_008981 [Fusarium duplospermum]
MRSSLAFLALVASTFAAPQAVTEDIRPENGPPKGCSESYDGTFEVTIYKSGKSKRDTQPRECNGEGVLVMTLKDGVLKDAQGRTGYISDSYQFQFDKPPQSGSIFTAGFSVCSNGTLALGPSAVFWQCLSGDFYNLYDRHWAEQCSPVEFGIMPCGEGSKDAPKKRVVGSSIVATTVVTVVSDGTTKEVPTTIAVPMCQIGDGQVQVRTTPCDDMNLPIITAPPVSQVSDGKLQIPTDAPPAPPAPAAPAAPAGAEPAEPENNAKGGEPSGDDAAGDSPPAAAGDEPAGDEPAGDEPVGGASSYEPAGEPTDDDDSGEEPGEPAAPAARPAGVSPGDDDAGSGPTATGGEAPANTGGTAGDEAPAGGAAAGSKPTGKSSPTGADDSEVLVTDSAPAPSGTADDEESEDTEEASATGKPTRAVKPFRPQSTDSDDAEETDSGSDATSSDEEASDQSASPESSAVKAVPAGVVLMMCVIGSLMML